MDLHQDGQGPGPPGVVAFPRGGSAPRPVQARLHTATAPGGAPGARGGGLSAEVLRRLAGVRVVAFDLDSTLIDFFRWKGRACESAVRALIDAGVDLGTTDAANVNLAEELLTKRLFDAYFRHGIEGEIAIAEFLAEVGEPTGADLEAIGVAGYIRGKTAALEPYPRTVPTLISLCKMGHRLALVTDAPRRKAIQRLAMTQLLPFFDTVVAGGDVAAGKDTDTPYVEMCRRLDVRPAEVLMVGDWPAKDVRSPKRLGMATALAKYGMQSVAVTTRREDEPDLVLGRIDDLTRILQTARRQDSVRP